MSSTTARYTANDSWYDEASWYPADAAGDLGKGPVYTYVSIWLLLLPILFLSAAGNLSILSAGLNNGTMTQNAALVGTAQAIRPQVIWYYLTMGYYILVAHKAILR